MLVPPWPCIQMHVRARLLTQKFGLRGSKKTHTHTQAPLPPRAWRSKRPAISGRGPIRPIFLRCCSCHFHLCCDHCVFISILLATTTNIWLFSLVLLARFWLILPPDSYTLDSAWPAWLPDSCVPGGTCDNQLHLTFSSAVFHVESNRSPVTDLSCEAPTCHFTPFLIWDFCGGSCILDTLIISFWAFCKGFSTFHTLIPFLAFCSGADCDSDGTPTTTAFCGGAQILFVPHDYFPSIQQWCIQYTDNNCLLRWGPDHFSITRLFFSLLPWGFNLEGYTE